MVKKRCISIFLFRTLIETGMRIGEASALCWKDYDRKLKTISITKSYNQKEINSALLKIRKTELYLYQMN